MSDAPAPIARRRSAARHWRHAPETGWHLVDWGCEFLGTMILVLGGLSAVVLDFGDGSPIASALPSRSMRLLLTGLLFAGCGSLVAISPLGRRSGAHLNPAVTLAFWCQRHLKAGDATGYAVAQSLGALAGAGTLRLIWGFRAASVGFGVTTPEQGLGTVPAVGVEAAMTAVLVLTIFGFVSSPRTARWTPLAVWVVVAILVWQGAPLTGTSLNPARSLGPAAVGDHWSDYFVYVAGPLAGALGAVALWLLVPRTTLTAKLFHDPRYHSVLGSHLPVRP
jgi:aquaporin Z